MGLIKKRVNAFIDGTIGISHNIIFNKTGLEWFKLQNEFVKYCEHISCLHCVPRKYNEDKDYSGWHCIIEGIPVLMYFKFNFESMHIDVIAIKDYEYKAEDTEGETQ
jgi:hypothetical protein